MEETQEIGEERPPLSELLEPLIKSQRDFLLARIWGLNQKQSLKHVNRTLQVLMQQWRKGPFRRAEKCILHDRESYMVQAVAFQLEEMTLTARLAFKELVDMSRNWESIPIRMLPHVMRAVMVLVGIPKHGIAEKDDYEEWLEKQSKKGGKKNA